MKWIDKGAYPKGARRKGWQRLRTAAAIFLMGVSCLWALFVVWFFLTIAWIGDTPKSPIVPALVLCGLLIGPLILIIGSVLSLRKRSSRTGSILVAIGCLILTGFVVYNSIAGMQRQPLEAPTPYSFPAVLLLLMLLSDIAAFKIFRATLWKSE
jgi:peptidoglycan/LPS O-acetylase OafA/YrhL